MIVIHPEETREIRIIFETLTEQIEVQRGGHLTVFIGQNPKLELEAILSGEGGSLNIVGVFRGAGSDTQDVALRVFQRAARTNCKVEFRAALAGSSFSKFDGLVRMEETAMGSTGALSYKALLLSEQARAKPIPRLEVLTKEVASASHSASVGSLDPQQLFYLQSRGLSREEAERLMVEGFLQYPDIRCPDIAP